MATHSSILAWKSPWAEEPGGAVVHGACKESDTTEHSYIYMYIHLFIYIYFILDKW